MGGVGIILLWIVTFTKQTADERKEKASGLIWPSIFQSYMMGYSIITQ